MTPSKELIELEKKRHAQEKKIEEVIHQLEKNPLTEEGRHAMELLETLEKAELELEEKELIAPPTTRGERMADAVARFGGSWKFISIFAAFLLIWMAINIFGWISAWDPYPFILLNLVLSCLAAIQAPIIMMSQNRQGERDRERDDINFERTKLDLEVDTLTAKNIRNAEIAWSELIKRIHKLEKKVDKALGK